MSDREEAGTSLWDDQFRAIMDSCLDAVIAVDIEGRIVDWSRQAEQTFGWSRADALGQELAGLIVPREYQRAHRHGLQHFQQSGEAPVVGKRLELPARRRDGTAIPIELSITRVEIHGRTFFNAFVRDITEWRKEEELHSRRMMEAELMGQMATQTARADTFEESLQRCLTTICGETGWPVGHVWVPDDAGRHLVSTGIWHVESDVRLQEFQEATKRVRLRQGSGLPGRIWKTARPVWMEDVSESPEFLRRQHCLSLPFRGAFGFPVISDGQVVAVLEFFTTKPSHEDSALLDIVARLGTQIGDIVQARRLEHQQARLAAIVDSSYDAIIGKAMDGTITSWNKGAEQIYGYSEDEALGRTISIILPPDAEGEEPEVLRAVESGQRLDQLQTTRRRKDGALIPVSLTVSPIVDSSGRIVGSSTIERDITGRLRRERELQQAKDSAVQAIRARREFLANVSHELRTPMNAIIGMTRMALEEDLSAEVREYIGTVDEAAHSLLTLLNDILDFSKLESSKFQIAHEPFSVAEIVDETVKTLSSQAFAKGLELVCELPPELPREVIGDAVRLRQILTNLVSNAIKFTEQGEVVLQVKIIRTWPREIRLRFSVRDSGIGISVDDQAKILEPFTQVDSSSTRQHGGTGLGLAICRELLRLMGGRLSLQSEMGRGSTFSFRLLFQLPADAEVERTDPRPLEKLKQLAVLVVDDNETNRRVVTESLRSWSMRPATARDASQALDMFQQARERQADFALVIVDALMPGMDGYQLAERLAQLAETEPTPVILMVSSTDRREFKDRERRSDIAAYLLKPVTQSDLLEAVRKALRLVPADERQPSKAALKNRPLVALSILLAEDTPANQKVVTKLLTRRGHLVTVANNGREAVEYFKQQDYDVVLMDIQMPILDGFQATAAMRDHEKQKGSSTPIVAMTAHAMRGDRERCLEAGMDAYVAKPVDADQLLGLIESIAEQPQAAKLTHSLSGKAVLDYQGAMKRLRGDADLYREFIDFYDEDAEKLIDRIKTAVQQGDAKSLEDAAHGLKGLVANLGGDAVAEAANLLERSGRVGDLQQTPQQCRLLLEQLQSFHEALENYRR